MCIWWFRLPTYDGAGTWAQSRARAKCESPFNLKVIRKRNDYKLSRMQQQTGRLKALIDFQGKSVSVAVFPRSLAVWQSGRVAQWQKRSAAENRHKLHDAFWVLARNTCTKMLLMTVLTLLYSRERERQRIRGTETETETECVYMCATYLCI